MKEIEGIDLLIETHDIVEFGIEEYLYKNLSLTHKIEIIRSIEETEKPYHTLYQIPILEQCTTYEKYKLLHEKRTGMHKWFYCEAKN